MASYRGSRDHLDDVIEFAVDVVERERVTRAGADGDAATRAAAELRVAVGRERLAARLDATAAAGVVLPWPRLGDAFGLSPTEREVLALLVAREVAPARFDGDAGFTLERLDRLVYGAPAVRELFAVELAADGALLGHGLCQWRGADGVERRADRPLRPHPRVVELAYGRLALAAEVAGYAELHTAPDAGAALIVAAEVRAAVTTAVRAQLEGGEPAAQLVGPRGSGRRSLALAAAAAAGRAAIVVSGEALATAADVGALAAALVREARLFDAVLIFADLDRLAADARAPGDRARALDAHLRHARVPVVITTRPGGATALVPGRGAIPVDVPPPSIAERAQLWRRALPAAAAPIVDDAAARYTITGGVIATAGRAARLTAAAAERPITGADVQLGVRAAVEDRLALLGDRVDWRPRAVDLVLPDDLREELDELIARMTHRRQVLETWGFAARLGKGTGLPVLFSGPPGTGKTMAAAVVAGALGLDLYQIDLARMVSKYIGETEKHLAEVFDAAEAGHAILLFDEADSLFGKRTEVKSANDRYANLEVNYLLQRMEAFTGVTILTTNFDSGIDPAFRRRLAFHLAFPMPEAEERARLWRTSIPAAAACADDVDVAALGARFVMSGGYIRNAAVRAAYRAAAAGSPITMALLVQAAIAESAAMGRVVHGGG